MESRGEHHQNQRPRLAGLAGLTALVACALYGGLLGTPSSTAEETILREPGTGTVELAITRLGNEGFALATDGTTQVLIDALYGDGIEGYEVVPGNERRRLERALPPYDRVHWVLASHVHGDHFDARAVSAFLVANGEARFLSTPQAVAQLRPLVVWPRIAERVQAAWPDAGDRIQAHHAEIGVTAVRLHHGEGTEAQNLGLLVELGGVTVLHMGDTEASVGDVRALHLERAGIDVALAPYWYFLHRRLRSLLESLGAPVRVVMHLAAPDAPPAYFDPARSRADQERRILEADPEAVLLDRLATHTVALPVEDAGDG